MLMRRFPKPSSNSLSGSLRQALGAMLLFASSGTVAEATDLISPVDQVGRYFGVCFGDGYHACNANRRTPVADLPIQRDTPRKHGHRFGGACRSGQCSISTEVLECNAPYLLGLARSKSCDEPDCDALGCDSVGCDAFSCDAPVYGAVNGAAYGDQRASIEPPTHSVLSAEPVASYHRAPAINVDGDFSTDTTPRASNRPAKRSRMIRPEIATDDDIQVARDHVARDIEQAESRRPVRIAVEPRKPRRM